MKTSKWNKILFMITIVIFAITFSGTAFAVLSHPNRYVRSVDITKDLAIIWFTGEQIGFSNCNRSGPEHHAVACYLSEPYCDKVVSIALAARLADQQVEFSISGSCVQSFNKIGRFRLEHTR